MSRKPKIDPHPDQFEKLVCPLGRVEESGYSEYWRVRIRDRIRTRWLRTKVSRFDGRIGLVDNEGDATVFRSFDDARAALDCEQIRRPLVNGAKVEILRRVDLWFEEAIYPLSPLEQLALQAPTKSMEILPGPDR